MRYYRNPHRKVLFVREERKRMIDDFDSNCDVFEELFSAPAAVCKFSPDEIIAF